MVRSVNAVAKETIAVRPGSHVQIARCGENEILIHRTTGVIAGTLVRMACGMLDTVTGAVKHSTTDGLSCVWCIAGTMRFPHRLW